MSCRRGAAGKQLDNDSCLLILSSLAYSGSDEERLGQVTERNVDIASGGDNVVPHTLMNTTSSCQSCQCPNTIMVLYEPTDYLSHPFTHTAPSLMRVGQTRA